MQLVDKRPFAKDIKKAKDRRGTHGPLVFRAGSLLLKKTDNDSNPIEYQTPSNIYRENEFFEELEEEK